ncbi:LytR C-terminal domain-containing protein [Janthinobacterium sp.]|uniref:LytR C-terminal domain-containing protein n=1 Tax=Janthinobacterium sp. TaxID=1871054 RepID=UPI0025838C3E|nr:LytR C-terminal domain-containing protein [Janthinobacterium sp.]MCX7294341.1 LytR C-terminal domain-containing protein [Janthinobacterium sp.]
MTLRWLRMAVWCLLACLLQGCAARDPAPHWQVRGVQRIGHSAGQDAATYFELGKFHQARGQLALAADAYAASIALEPQQLAARNAQAVLDARQGRLEQAAKALLALVHDYPEAAQPRNNLGYVYYLQGELALAAGMLEQAVARAGGAALARNNLQLVHAGQAAALAQTAAATAPVAPVSAVAPEQAAAVEIINGNGIRGMAAQVRLRVQARGMAVSRLANLPGFRQARSQILYAPGNARQADALRLALAQRGETMQLVPVASLARGAGIRVVLGRDLA